MRQINFSVVNATTDVALWASQDATRALVMLQEKLNLEPESAEKIALELAIENAIDRHKSVITGFDALVESIGLFQLEVGELTFE